MIHLLLALIYISFISLGLPDSLLGAAWPSAYESFGVPLSYAGVISLIISAGTVISSLQCDRLTRRLSTGKVLAISVAMTAVALLGFSASGAFWMMCVWAIPYGLGAGCVDASLNNYVALHYPSRHMSWLHCMWGLGASIGPYIMGCALSGGHGWNMGYRYVGLIQIVLSAVILFSLPLWKKGAGAQDQIAARALSVREILKIRGAKETMISFFSYCALEQTAALWGASYLVLHSGMDAETAAGMAGMFFIGITAGRAASGFLTLRFSNTQMIRIGQGVLLAGIAVLFLPLGSASAVIGLILVGLGCAPIYPSFLHSTPDHFGADRSQAIIGVQMASAYVGTCLMPPLFGLIANHISAGLLPVFLLVLLALMAYTHERMRAKTAG